MPLARVKVWAWATLAAGAWPIALEAGKPCGACAVALQLLASKAVAKESPKRKFGFIECMILEIQAMFSFFKKKSPPAEVPSPTAPAVVTPAAPGGSVPTAPTAATEPTARQGWLDRLKAGLRKTGSSITTVFTGTRIDEELYEELETALLLADTGVKATEHLLQDLKRRVKDAKATEPSQVKTLLADALTDLLQPLQKPLSIGDHQPTVIMVAGVNGAGKTTSIGKLTKHLADEGLSVLLAAADTFRAAAKEQLAVWATRNTVEIVSQQGGDPAAVSFDAVSAGRARGRDVVLVDTAGRLPTQLHLMEELKKIKRVVQKADGTAPHEVLLVIDGNTGQNALAQVKAFDEALGLTGLIVTKLDGTAKGGVLCAIAREKPIPVYFIGVGEKLEDLETFNAREFAQALLS
jgi:fused signal recognition particle receptor